MVDSQVAIDDHVLYCFDALLSHFSKSKCPKPLFHNHKYPLFVTWHKYDNGEHDEPSLRGCIGTFDPKEIHAGLKEYALISALKDSRFSPITSSELELLECSVSLLHAFEDCDHASDWVIGKHGIIINFRDPDGTKRNATYLPEVAFEQQWSHQEAVKSLIRKAGYKGTVSKELYKEIKTTRYQSSQCKMRYHDYLDHKYKKKHHHDKLKLSNSKELVQQENYNDDNDE